MIHKLETIFWERHSASQDPKLIAVALRDRWCYNDSFQCIVRAESLWKEELSDMVHYKNSVRGEPDAYEVMVRVLWDGKTNQKNTSKSFLAQCFRHIEAKQCAIGSKAMYLFARFVVTEEEFDFTNNDWFEVKTAVALADRSNKKVNCYRKKMGPKTYEKVIKRAQKESGIITGKNLHVGRKIGVIIPQLDGTPYDETMILGNWAKIEGTVFHTHYNARIPFSAMRSCAGAGKDVGRYYIPRSHFKASKELQSMVWPNIERAKEHLFSHRHNEKYVTAHRFIKTMDYLREVLLQDAAFFISQCPDRANHTLIQYPLFHSAAFQKYMDEFAVEYPRKVLPENDPTLKHVQLVVPQIGNTLQLAVTEVKAGSLKMNDIGKALADHSERSYQQKVTLYQTMLQRFKDVEVKYLEPISRDVGFLAGLLRNGTNGILNAARMDRAHANQGTHVTPPNQVTPPNLARPQAINNAMHSVAGLNLPHTNVAAQSPQRHITQGNSEVHENIGYLPGLPDVQDNAKCTGYSTLPPGPDEYNSLIAMYFDWVGVMDKGCSLKLLFSDTTWRKLYCPKNSATMKRMQRMKDICNVVDRYLVGLGLTIEHGEHGTISSSEDIAKSAHDLLINVFGEEPDGFSWTKYAKCFKEYAKNQNMS